MAVARRYPAGRIVMRPYPPPNGHAVGAAFGRPPFPTTSRPKRPRQAVALHTKQTAAGGHRWATQRQWLSIGEEA